MSTTENPSPAPIQAQNSPRSRQSRKSSVARGVSSPSSIYSPPRIVDEEQILALSPGSASDSLPAKDANTIVAEDVWAPPAGDDVQHEYNDAGAAKKPAWNVPSNGAEAGVVMGAESWPALSESTRASPKSPASYSVKALPHGSQELADVSLSSPKEVSNSILSPNSIPSHAVPSRHKSMKRGGGNSSHNSMSANDSLSHAPPIQQGAVADPAPSNPGKSVGSVGELSRDKKNKDGNESQLQRSSFRRSNSGPLNRGDGSYQGNHRRNHERQDWGNRSFGGRERAVSRSILRGPTPNAPLIHPSLSPVVIRPFGAPVVYTEMQSPIFYVPGPHPDPLRPMHTVPSQSMFYPMSDPHLPSKIVNQIDYYFSNENLVKDTFLRQNMDAEGWVSIGLIAGFKKVMQLTDNIELILDAIKVSNVVEVQGEKVRRKGDWIKWIMPPLQTTVSSPPSINSSQNMLVAHLNSVTLDEKAAI